MLGNGDGIEIFLQFIRVLVLRKKIILFLTLFATSLSVVVVLLTPSSFKSVCMIKPPKTEGSSSIEAALKETSGSSGLAGMLGSFIAGGESGEDDCFTILNSASFGKLVIDKFELTKEYKFGVNGKKYFFADVLKEFQKNAEFETTENGAIKISMEDKSPERASEVVAFMVESLDSIYTNMQRVATKQRLIYVDQRVSMTEADVKRYEDSLVEFQNKHNLFLPEVQVQAILENATKTELEIESIKEELALENAIRGKESSRFQNLTVQKGLLEKSLKQKLRSPVDTNSLGMPVKMVPALATEYFRIERGYKVKLGLYKYLIQQAEALKLDNDKNFQVITILDHPWINDKRVSPKRRIIIEAVFVLSLIFSSVFVVFLEYWDAKKKSNSVLKELVFEIKTTLFKF